MRGTIRRITILSALSAILIISQVALAFLPNIEIVTLLLVLYGLLLGKYAIPPMAVFILVEGLIYGFSLWFINYLYVWPILLAVVFLLKKHRSPVFWAVANGIFGLCFGALCAIPYFFIGGIPAALAYWISGIPFDLLHCFGNIVAALTLFHPLYRVGSRFLADAFPSALPID